MSASDMVLPDSRSFTKCFDSGSRKCDLWLDARNKLPIDFRLVCFTAHLKSSRKPLTFESGPEKSDPRKGLKIRCWIEFGPSKQWQHGCQAHLVPEHRHWKGVRIYLGRPRPWVYISALKVWAGHSQNIHIDGSLSSKTDLSLAKPWSKLWTRENTTFAQKSMIHWCSSKTQNYSKPILATELSVARVDWTGPMNIVSRGVLNCANEYVPLKRVPMLCCGGTGERTCVEASYFHRNSAATTET